jgi:hypothetical protein
MISQKYVIVCLTVLIIIINLFSGCIDDSDDRISEDFVGYWNFNEGKGTIAFDQSDFGNDGIIHNAAWNEGIVDNCLLFNGHNSSVSIEDFQYNFDEISIQAWVKIINYDNEFGKIVDFGYCGEEHQPIGRRISIQTINQPYKNKKGISFNIDGTSVELGGGGSILYSTSESNSWIHIVATWKTNENLHLFINGELVGTTTTSIQKSLEILDDDNKIIGSRIDMNTDFFNGFIDEVKIYNRALNKNEVQILYKNGFDSCLIIGQINNIKSINNLTFEIEIKDGIIFDFSSFNIIMPSNEIIQIYNEYNGLLTSEKIAGFFKILI